MNGLPQTCLNQSPAKSCLSLSRLLLLLVLATLSGSGSENIFAQSSIIKWDRTFGGSLQEDFLDWSHPRLTYSPTDSTYLFFCSSNSPVSGDKTAAYYGSRDIWVLKFDLQGNPVWNQSYGGASKESPVDIIALPMVGILLRVRPVPWFQATKRYPLMARGMISG